MSLKIEVKDTTVFIRTAAKMTAAETVNTKVGA